MIDYKCINTRHFKHCSRCDKKCDHVYSLFNKSSSELLYDKYLCEYCANVQIKFKDRLIYCYCILSQLLIRDVSVKIIQDICNIYDTMHDNKYICV